MARALSFGLVGASGLIIDIALYFGLQWLGLEHRLSRFVSFWPALAWNWLLNRGIAFGERPKQPRMQQWAKFAASSLIGLGANVGSYTMLTTFVDTLDRYRLVAWLCGVGLGSVVNFTAATLYVYRTHSAPTPRQVARRRVIAPCPGSWIRTRSILLGAIRIERS